MAYSPIDGTQRRAGYSGSISDGPLALLGRLLSLLVLVAVVAFVVRISHVVAADTRSDQPLPNAGVEMRAMPRPALGDAANADSIKTISGARFPAVMLASKVNVSLVGPIARVEVRQTFQNNSPDYVEALYRFPLPDDSSVDGLTIEVGERLIKGVVKEKNRAKADYVAAVKAGKRAALLSEHRPNIFSTRIANVAPGETMTIRLTLVSLARLEDSRLSFTIPRLVTPRYAGPQTDIGATRDQGDIDGALADRLFLASPEFYADTKNGEIGAETNVRFHLHDSASLRDYRVNGVGVTPLMLAGNIAEIVPTAQAMRHDGDVTLSWRLAQRLEPQLMTFEEIVGDWRYSLGLIIPPQKPAVPKASLPRDILLIVDTSGSMQGEAIKQARLGLEAALNSLGSDDRFEIIAFETESRAFAGDWRPVGPASLAEARAWVRALEAEGGTNMGPPLVAALQSYPSDPERLQQVVFLTDGAVYDEAQLFGFVDDNLGSKRLFTIGVGAAPNGWFMRKAAEFGRGQFVAVSNLQAVNETMTQLFDAMARPRLTGLSLVDAGEAFPVRLGDVYGSRATLFVARTEARGEARASVRGTRGDGTEWASGSARSAHGIAATSGTPFGIDTYWARRKVEDLIDQRILSGDPTAFRDEMVAVSLEHQILSPETRFLAVEQKRTRPADKGVKQKLIKEKGGLKKGEAGQRLASASATAIALPAGSSGWARHLLWGLGLMLSALMLVAIGRRRVSA